MPDPEKWLNSVGTLKNATEKIKVDQIEKKALI